MQPPVPRGNNKIAVEPVAIVTENQFTPKISERTIRKQEERKLNGSKYAIGLNRCGVIWLYIFLIICILIGAGGIAVCAVYFNIDNVASKQGWIIAGLAMGIAVFLIGIILTLLTIFKHTRKRPWQYKEEEQLYNDNDDHNDTDDDDDYDDDDDQTNSQGSADEKRRVSHFTILHSPVYGKTRETATSPIRKTPPPPIRTTNPPLAPLDLKTITDDIIFCPGCNRSHPSSHQCMYSTRIANGFATKFQTTIKPTHQDSVAIQTEEDGKKKKKIETHTAIDRSLKYSNTINTQTDVSDNPRSNITDSIILRRVPIPTAKVVVQQPTTKVMIVKVPNVAGQLVIQPKSGSTDEQPK